MKNIIVAMVIIFMCSSTFASEKSIFNIYYLPLEMQFYVPPSREDIIKMGINFKIKSCLLQNIFTIIDKQNGLEPFQEDYSGLRIMIVNQKNNDELFITDNKVLLSIVKNKRYSIDMKLINETLIELKEKAGTIESNQPWAQRKENWTKPEKAKERVKEKK